MIAMTDDASPAGLRAERQRLAYLLAAHAHVHWETALGAIERGARHVRAHSSRARILEAAASLGIELP